MARNPEQIWEDLCKKKYLTLMHLYMMVFKKHLNTNSQKDFTDNVLSDYITNGIDFETYGNAASNLLRKITGQVKQSQYVEIRDRLRKPNMVAFDDQTRVLRELTDSNSDDLWGAMKITYPEINNMSYLDVFKNYSPWLFKERNLDNPNEYKIYKLLTVAIFISVNLQTSSTDTTEDELDHLCEKFLEEELPDFSLRTLFDTLFANHSMFAIMQDDRYIALNSGSLTDLDRVNILLPNNVLRHSIIPGDNEYAQRLLDNQIDKETANRVLGFFECYSSNVWALLVSHIRKTFIRCQFAASMHSKGKKNKQIELALSEMSEQDHMDLAEVFRNRLDDEDGNHVCWISNVCDSFWGGVKAESSLPPVSETEEFDAQKLFECIAAYLLIALYCLKMDGNAVPLKRRRFRKKLEALISEVFFDNNHGSMELVVEKKEQRIAELERTKEANERTIVNLTQKLKHMEHANAENENSLLISIATLVSTILDMLPTNSPIERQEYAEAYCRAMPNLNEIQISRILNWLKVQDESKSLIRITTPPGWDNGGN